MAVRLLALHSLLEALTLEHEAALVQLQFNLPQGACRNREHIGLLCSKLCSCAALDKTDVMRLISQSRKLRGHALQTSLSQHIQNLSGASLAMAFESMKQLNRQGKQYWCKRELTPRHVKTVLERCISENVVGQSVQTLNTSQVLPTAIFPHLHRITTILGNISIPSSNIGTEYWGTEIKNTAAESPHLKAIELRCSRWWPKVHVLALVWKQCLPQLSKDVIVSISNAIL